MQERLCRAVMLRPSISAVDLAGAVYADDPDGGPLYAENNIRKLAARIRLKLLPFGWTLTGETGTKGYRFLRVPE